jgi:hypothetical protein
MHPRRPAVLDALAGRFRKVNLQCRSNISLHLDLQLISRHFETKPKINEKLTKNLLFINF